MNPYRGLEDHSFSASPHLTYEDIATKLLKDHYFLTALELHTELVESGKELPQLREFFSNPGNFEQHVSRADLTSMHRTPSQATLDSLDTARYSEDGGGDRTGSGGDVAVLEFELRKAKETINALRANLTQCADEDSPLDKKSKDIEKHSLKPHEKRALNFLINEYLLIQGYKLTSITFSDENPDQDFEDWDDVGLNIPRPSGLVSLFWGNKCLLKVSTNDASTEMDWKYIENQCQTDISDETNLCSNCQHSDADGDWHHELLIQAEEIKLLKQKVIDLETEKHDFQKLYDAAILSLNSLTSPTIENKSLNVSHEKLISSEAVFNDSERPLTLTATDNHYGSNTHSTHSATPDQFELIDNEKNNVARKDGSNTSSYDPAIIGENSTRDSPLRRGSVTTLDETLSINDGGEWTRVQYDYNMETNSKDMWLESGIPNNLKNCLLNWCSESLHKHEPIANDLLLEMINGEKQLTLQGLLMLVADTMPRVIPHMLVARRCEIVALLVGTIHLLSLVEGGEVTRRSRLLHSLLTLKKAPEVAETKIICEAACLIVKWGSSGEMLSCIAELLSSKSAERRVLASQICLSVAPYVSVDLSTSLLLSLVVLMCESSELEVRSLGLKAACLITPVGEHKYGQLENLLFNFLRDPSENILKDAVSTFAPILARTALIAGKFSSDLMKRVISNLEKMCNDKDWKGVSLYLSTLKSLVLPTLVYVINVQIVKDVTLTNCDNESMQYQEICLEKEQNSLLDIQCYLMDPSVDGKTLLGVSNSLLKEKPDVRWPELDWFITLIKQILEISTKCSCLHQTLVYEHIITLCSSYVKNFGPSICLKLIKPTFMDIILDLEHKMEKLQSVANESTIVVGVYLATVLPALGIKEEFISFIHKWIVYSSIRNLPVKLLSVPLRWVSKHKSESLQKYLSLLRQLATSTSESSSGVATRAYICNLIADLLNSAEVSEEDVQSHLLPIASDLIHDHDSSVRECAVSAWGSVARVCVTRRFECESQCWSAIESYLQDGNTAITAREAARAAESLALLVLPTTDTVQMSVCDKAVTLICELCLRAPLTSESLNALTPGLQLVAHHARSHPALLPALRRLEEGVQAPALSQYKPAIEALMYNIAGSPSTTSGLDVSRESQQKMASTNLQAAQEVGRRVTQMFQQSKSNMNLQNIFKKKT